MSGDSPPVLPEEAPATPPPQPERTPFWGYSDMLLFVGLALPAMLGGMGMVKLLLLAARVHLPGAAELLTEQFAGYAALFLVLTAIFRLQHNRPFWESLGWRHHRIGIITLVMLGLATAFAIAFIAAAIRTPITDNPMTQLLKSRTSLILVAVFGVTIGPLAEELIFRGFLQPLFVRSLGAAAGIVAAAVPFGMLHFWEYGKSWRHVVLIAAAGAAFGVVRHITGSTRASTLMHAAYNAVLFVGLLVQGQLPRAG